MNAILADDGRLVNQVLKFNVLGHGLVDFVLVGRHLFLGAAVHDVDLLGTEADGRAAAVHRGEAGTEHGNTLADVGRLAVVGPGQQANAVHDALEVCTGNDFVIRPAHGLGVVAASSDVHGIVLFQQVGEQDIAPHAGVVADLDADVGHVFVALFARDGARQAPDGDAIDHDAAASGVVVINCDRVAHLAQVTRGGQAGGTTFQPADSDGFAIDFIAAADRFTGAGAGAAKHARYDVGLAVQQVRLVEASL